MGDSLTDQAAALPRSPGVYLFRSARGKVIYVGKAIDLRARVRQYLTGQDERAMVPFLVQSAASVDCVVTTSEKEAFILENTLIKKYRPRYNVKLRDDSNFLHLRLDPRQEWPRYTLVRRIKNESKKVRYFGPFHSASRARHTLAFLERNFPLRTCSDQVLRTRSRPCLLHQMGRCVAPCVDEVTPEAYADIVADSLMFLEGKKAPLIERLRVKMQQASEKLRFEAAARYRDLIASIEATLERQGVVDPRLADRDLWGVHRAGEKGAIAVLPIREGVMGEPTTQILPALVGSTEELLSQLLNTFYPEHSGIPPEILVPVLPDDTGILEELLSERRGGRVSIHAPQRGRKLKLLRLAGDNARTRYEAETDEDERRRRALEELARVLGLEEPPRRMECFDNSNLRGEHPVAAMAVFVDGQPDRGEYRRYRVKTVVGSDDYATMREILERRVRRGLEDGVLPDLLVVDGGKGQVAVARAVLEDLGVHDLPLVGVAKPRTERSKGQRKATDKIVLPNRKDPLRLGAHHPALKLLQHIRDEVHNHAVRYHRKVRQKSTLASLLEEIDGVGPARRKALLRHLGSAEGVARATTAELAEVPGIGPALAAVIHETLNP